MRDQPGENNQARSTLPAGDLTVMFTDIEGSTARWEADDVGMRQAVEHHNHLTATAVTDRGGVIVKSTGDGFCAVFDSPDEAIAAALALQRSMQEDSWPVERLKIRIGLHHGDLQPSDGDYYGPEVNRAARIMDIANGDQIVASASLAARLTDTATVDLGLHQLRGIGTERIVRIAADGLVGDDRPLRERVSRAVKPLPAAPSELLGRTELLAQIVEQLHAGRNIGLTGPGGVGKTHLALEAARAIEPHHGGGAVLCELAPVVEPEGVLEAIADALGARRQPAMSLVDSIVSFLQTHPVVLVLDNCEHVVDEVRSFGAAVERVPDVRLITTSRERLGLASEQVMPVEPLDPNEAGVDLFVARARDRDLAFEPTPTERGVIAEICAHVGGMPLGIELAAAWVRMLTVEELLAQLRAGPSLIAGQSGERTLHNAMAWSHAQLRDDQAALFNRLSVFAGGFTLDAVVDVCEPIGEPLGVAEVLALLRDLVDKSMISSERGTRRIRFRILEPLRAFGAARLDEEQGVAAGAELRRRHADHYLELAISTAEHFVSSKEAEIWDLLDAEWANIRHAWQTLRGDEDLVAASRLVLELGWFAAASMRFELMSWASELTEIDGFESRDGATGLLGLRALFEYLTIDPQSKTTAERGLALDHRDPSGYCRMALTAVALNNLLSAEESDRITSEWMERLDEETSPMARLWCLGMRVFHLCYNAPSEEVADLVADMAETAGATESATAAAITHWAAGMVATFTSLDAGLAEWQRGIDAASSVSDVHLMLHLIWGLELHVGASHGPLEVVLPRTLEILSLAHRQHYLAGTSHLFGVTAIALVRADRPEAGAQLLGSMLAAGHVPRHNARRAVEKALGDSAETAIDSGRQMDHQRAAAFAIDQMQSAVDALAT